MADIYTVVEHAVERFLERFLRKFPELFPGVAADTAGAREWLRARMPGAVRRGSKTHRGDDVIVLDAALRVYGVVKRERHPFGASQLSLVTVVGASEGDAQLASDEDVLIADEAARTGVDEAVLARILSEQVRAARRCRRGGRRSRRRCW